MGLDLIYLLKNLDLKIEDKNIVWVGDNSDSRRLALSRDCYQKSFGLRFLKRNNCGHFLISFAYGNFTAKPESKSDFSFGARHSIRFEFVPRFIEKIFYCLIDVAEGQSLRQCCQRKFFLLFKM